MTPNTDVIHRMCSDIPVSSEDAVGLSVAVHRLTSRPQQLTAESERCAQEQLARDLIEQARSESVGG